eukprot:3690520-Rhodomonas_salina.1
MHVLLQLGVRPPILLRAPYAMSATDLGPMCPIRDVRYSLPVLTLGPTRSLRDVRYQKRRALLWPGGRGGGGVNSAICLRACYAMSGTDVSFLVLLAYFESAYRVLSAHALPGTTDIVHIVLSAYATRGADIAYQVRSLVAKAAKIGVGEEERAREEGESGAEEVGARLSAYAHAMLCPVLV